MENKQRKSLVEHYKPRLTISEAIAKTNGKTLSLNDKTNIASVLANTQAFINYKLNESFLSTSATQKSDIVSLRRFCLDITDVAMPGLIANEVVMVKALPSEAGYIEYLAFVAGTDKGSVKVGDELNGPFKLGAMTDGRRNYTSAKVEDPIDSAATTWTPKYTPIVEGSVYGLTSENKWEAITLVDGSATFTAGKYSEIKYFYDNVVIPQKQLATIKAVKKRILLEAEARRIAIEYSQIAAFTAKMESGTDLGDLLAEAAVAELEFTIDSDIIAMLNEAATDKDELNFNTVVPLGLSRSQHYADFLDVVETASQLVYDATSRFGCNYMICSSSVKKILAQMPAWKASNKEPNGPYFAGTLNHIKVYVSPAIAKGRYFFGFNGKDLQASAGVFAPYMAVIPTQLLGFEDGSMTQGFSTMYAKAILNANLLVAGKLVEEAQVVNTKASE